MAALKAATIGFGDVYYQLKLIRVARVRQNRNLEVAVFGAQFVDERLLLGGVLHLDLVGKAEHGAHAGGLDTHVLRALEILIKGLVEGAVVLEGFRDRDLEQLLPGALFVLVDRKVAEGIVDDGQQ